ncbi:MAG: VanZ family protein [Moraxellaceae bacterium]|nr:VanZ family protein [Moraxellaceae bacterium]
MSERHSPQRLPQALALAYALLTAYACLHPLSGWRSSGVGPFDFLTALVPPYYTKRDLLFNVLGFVPLGFTAAAALRPSLKAGWTVVVVSLLCALLSLSVETMQNYLPGRISSNLDLAMNSLGGFIGALAGARWHTVFDRRGALHRWRIRRVLPGHAGELGLLLLGLWWLTQLWPDGMLFSSGDLRALFELPGPMSFSARRYIALETAVVASNLLAVGLIARRCQRSLGIASLLFLLLTGLLVVTLATTLFVAPEDPLRWASPGAQQGLLLGAVLLVVALRLPSWLQLPLACMALLSATALVNMAPQNPFVLHISQAMLSGHSLNFLGLTEWVARLWPFLALAWLTVFATAPTRADKA